MHDGLGSVRQLVDNTGQIATNYAYDPFGVPLSENAVYNPFRFTGEGWDAEVELLYLRARYYQPEVGRFITRDPWDPNVHRPGTLNGFVYVTNNPVNYTDPSGLQGPDPLGLGGLERPTRPAPGPLPVPPGHPNDFVDDRDIMTWLVEELRGNALEAMLTMRPLLTTSSLTCNAAGLALWLRRVADDHTWDFKDQIVHKLDGSQEVVLRHGADDYAWYEYSLPGNINFGYAGRAAGWSGLLLHAGASFAEITDPAHQRTGEANCLVPRIPDRMCPKLYLNPRWKTTLYDDPRDYSSVQFGIQLYEQHPIGLTVDQFRAFLSTHSAMLRLSMVPMPSDAGEYRNEDSPYRRGYFNGPRSDPWPFAWPVY